MPGASKWAHFKEVFLFWSDRLLDIFIFGVFTLAVFAAPAVSVYQYFRQVVPQGCTPLLGVGGEDLHAVAYYVHIVPIMVLLLVAGFILVSSHEGRTKRIFALFVGAFSLWLVGDLITWVSGNEAALYAAQTTLSFLEIAFFVLGAYFAALLLYGGRVPTFLRLLFPLILLAPLLVIFNGNLTSGFFHGLCNPFGHGILAAYPLYAEVIILGLLAYFWARVPYSTFPSKPLYAIIASLFMFLGTFAIGSFVVWLTSHHEFLFYGLLALPVFLIVLVYSITNLELFRVQSFGIQVLIYLILLLISAQFLFVDSLKDQLLIGITLVFTAIFGYLFQQSALREVVQRHKIEVLAGDLKDTNQRQESLIHFVGHEVKGFLTKDQGAFAELAEGDLGPLPQGAKSFAETALSGTRDAVRSISDILAASNLKKGTTTFQMVAFDLKKVIAEAVEKAQGMAKQKGLALSFAVPDLVSPYLLQGDPGQLGDHVFRNIIENAINYTPSGFVQTSLKKEESKYVFTVKDTGVGITDEDKKHLFTEGGHGKDSQKINVHSTGYGLFIAKNIVEAHRGTIRVESEGEGKGTTFIVELPV